ncbi:MAG TPA: hypothetical protein PKC37_00250 [Kaistella sp.]|jgi:hypothetical protein|uniref:hypothetical protein n=1 Tax=Candidatus Kaistella beijingensis TaxID=2820270 RepID=UPI000ED9B3A4|nr:hypothetical protein [Candidatus Kaistella beijingensis]MBN8622761.1 hypothetical protein [Flavobacteriales bacterium]MCA0392024.1 hypothetical protein [Bacteroidota bacterium]HCN12338.1 hypothetical protein [Chryseobacterium sp.]HMU06308.1 hypothetical protein [Kaistella sp.]UBB89374.1 hypothetical protein J4771_10990 [Candidatus Kaistella beijingensis]
MADWKFASLIEVDKEYKVDGLNIWNHYWNCSDRKIEVRGPFEGQVYFFNEYEIKTPEKTVTFVAGEFSNQKIGIYLKDDLSGKKL